MYVIERRTVEYVAVSGSESSYTKDLVRARKFYSKEEAEQNCCGDERVVDLFSLLGR